MQKKLTDKFNNILWFGGSPCSGKSTCVDYLAHEYGFSIYRCDDYMFTHMEKADPSKSPAMYKLKNMTWDEIFMRPVNDMLMDEIDFYHEEFDMIINDIDKLENSKRIIVEGAAILPELIKKAGVKPNQVLYLLPTKEFQIENYSKREFIKEILKACVNPEEAFMNWMERDHAMSKYLRQNATDNGYKYFIIDGSRDIDCVIKEVETYFKEFLRQEI